MRLNARLLSLLVLSACSSRTRPVDEVPAGPAEPSEFSRSPSASPTPLDGGPPEETLPREFHWSDALGRLPVQEVLAGRPLSAEEEGDWESRTLRPTPAAPSAPGAELAGGADLGGIIGTKGVALGAGGLGTKGSGLGGGGGTVVLEEAALEDAVFEEAAIGRAEEGVAHGMMDLASEDSRHMGMAVPTEDTAPVGRAPGAVPSSSGSLAKKARGGGVAAPALKAGTVDDNEDFDEWLRFVESWSSQPHIAEWADPLDVSGRRILQVLDAGGRPVPDARLSVLDPRTEEVVWAGRTYGDGRAPLYPRLRLPGSPQPLLGEAPEGGWLVQASTPDGGLQTVRWTTGAAELQLRVDTPGLEAGAPVPVDVCFIIDTTGSMSDELSRIKSTLLSVTDKLRSDASQGVDLRYGAVLYRDIGDEYVTRRHAFTAELERFDRGLQTISAAGGGDSPESLNQGLAVGVAGMDWREGAARVAFVIADAPPHMDYVEDVSYGRAAAAAVHRGIRVHTVAASGLSDRGSFAFRQIAQLTRGQFIYIQYGSAAASAADHGVRRPSTSNNLDDILYGRIRAEIDGWGKDGSSRVVRR